MRDFESCLIRSRIANVTYSTNRIYPSSRKIGLRRPCEPLNNLTLLHLGGGSHLKRGSYPSPIGLVFWGDWVFTRGVRRSTVLRLPRFRSLGPSGLLRPDRCVAFSAVSAKIAGFGKSGSVRRAFHPIPPGPDSSFGIRAGPLLRGWE